MATDRLDTALQAARMYYEDHRSMEAVASTLSVSRSTVSRLLALARERGLVEIRLHDPDTAIPNLARRLSERLHLDAHVVPHTSERLSDRIVLERVARYGGRLLCQLVSPDAVVAVAWGTTISTMSRHMQPAPTQGVRVVQLNGAGNHLSTGIEYASEVLQRVAGAFNGRVEQFPVPTFFDDPATKRAMWKERSIRRVLDLQASADVVVFGIGTFDTGHVPSHVYRAGYLDPADLAHLADVGVVGDVATVFLRQDGTHHDIAVNDRSTGPDPCQLAQAEIRLCVVAGRHRLPPLLGALAAGLVSHLVLDEPTAVALEEALDEAPGRG